MTTVRWNRKDPFAIDGTLVTQEHQAELVRAFREAWRPVESTKGAASPSDGTTGSTSRPPIEVHVVRLARRKR